MTTAQRLYRYIDSQGRERVYRVPEPDNSLRQRIYGHTCRISTFAILLGVPLAVVGCIAWVLTPQGGWTIDAAIVLMAIVGAVILWEIAPKFRIVVAIALGACFGPIGILAVIAWFVIMGRGRG